MAIEFFIKRRDKIKKDPTATVLNADQSGFKLETLLLRSLSFKDEKDTARATNSSHTVSHSYTIQLVLAMDGISILEFLLIYIEQSRNFGPHIFKN